MKKMHKTSRAFFFAAGMLILGASQSFSQGFTENFDDITTLAGSGWVTTNASSPLGGSNWTQGDNSVFSAFNGNPNSYIFANYLFTSGTGTISGWLISPQRTFRNGDVVTFYTRKTSMDDFADRLEVRLSTAGASTNVGTGTTVGDFTTNLLTINPNLSLGGVYPTTWTLYTITISGLSAPTSGRIAFRYFVTNGGPNGANSDYIGIDNVVYTPYVCPTISLTPNSLPSATAGVAYTQNLSQSGALGTPAFTVTAGALPSGMTLSSAGVLSGTPTAPGTFNFTVTVGDASGCTGSASYSLTVACPANPISFAAFPSICQSGSPVTLDQGTPAGGTYSGVNVNAGVFDPSAGSQSITYDYTDEFGCAFSSSQTFTVNTNPAAPLISASGPTTFCEGDSVILTSSYATNNAWSGGETATSITVYDAGFYTVTHTDANNCSSPPSAATTVIVNAVPAAPIITPSGSTTICEGTSITLSSSASSGNMWSTMETTQTITVSGAGTFSVSTTENGCTSETSTAVTTTVAPLPVADFTVSGTSPSFTFTSTSTNATGVSWNFGDGSPANPNATATHTYTTNGTFTVTLTATNSCGTDTETEDVVVFGFNLNELSGLENLHIFPNPTDALLNISFQADSPKEMVLKIVDGQGKTIFVENLGTVAQEFSRMLDVTHLAPGVYMLSLESADGSKAVQRFVKH